MQFPKQVTIHEVCPRDGFQPEERWIPTATKIEIVDALSRTGVTEIQATSFVHPRAIPQLRDAEEVMAGITKQPGLRYDALVPNLRGAERAAATAVDVWHLRLSASESHNRETGNRAIAETLAGFPAVVELAHERGVEVHGGLAVAFGCPYEGDVPLEQLTRIVGEYVGRIYEEIKQRPLYVVREKVGIE